ncbi:MAG TPA: universal stress protein, partial [Asanoa sp.]
IVAVGATADADEIVDAAADLARGAGAALEVVRVHETMVIEDLAIDPEDERAARAALAAHLDRLIGRGVDATGQLLHSVGDHAAAGRVLAQHAADLSARLVVVGRSPRGPVAQFAEGSFTAALTRATTGRVVLVRPDEEPRELTAESVQELGRV